MAENIQIMDHAILLDPDGIPTTKYVSGALFRGYLNTVNNQFYKDALFTLPEVKSINAFYMTLDTQFLYRYDTTDDDFKLVSGKVDDLKPSFTTAIKRENIASGDTISTLFGKISKFFTDLKDTDASGASTVHGGAFNELEGSDYIKLTTANNKTKIETQKITTSVTKDSTDLVTSGAVWTAIDNLAEPMVFKGTLGTGGTITTLPAATAANEGFTYKVITAGTYASIVCKVGDVLVSNGTEWVLIPAGDVDSDTWRNIKINGTEKLGSGISTGAVDFVNGTNTTVTFNATGNKIAINLSSLISISATAPTNGALIWVDTTNGYILKVRESASGSWTAPRAVWG